MGEDFPAHLAGFREGSLVAGYRLEAQVGAGGMAVVFRARDERLNRLVALKILVPALAMDVAFRRRFIAESRAAAVVDDPHIIPVYEAREADGVLFIAMRFVSGGDLRQVLDREGALSPGRAAEFISPVASALDAAHGAGLVHRDVKPANILVDARPERPDHVYLSDFGVSKGALSSVSLTAAGQFLGTPGYSAPEQIQGQAVDGRADQYSLACVAYQLLTGTAPFERDQGMAVLLAHLSEPAPSLSSRRLDLPGAADQVLARALAKVPEKRYGSCREFGDALRDALGLVPYHSRGSASALNHPQSGGLAAVDAPAAAIIVTGTSGSDATTVLTEPAPVAELGKPAAQVDGPASAVNILPAEQHAGRGAGSSRIRHYRLLVIGLAGAVLAAAVVVPFVLASSPNSRHANPPSPSVAGSLTYKLAGTLAHLPADGGGVNWMAFSRSGKILAASEPDPNGSAYVWNIATKKPIATFTDPSSGGINQVALSPDGTTLAVGDSNGSAYLWNIATKKLIATFTDPSSYGVDSLAFSPDGTTLAASDNNGSAYLWNISAKKLTATLADLSSSARTVAFGADGKTLAVSDVNGPSYYLWNIATKKLTTTLSGPSSSGAASAIAFSPDGTTLAVSDVNGRTYLWNITTKNLTATFADPHSGQDGVDSVAFSPDGMTLATGDSNSITYLWNISAKKLTATLSGPSSGGGTLSVAFSPNGTTLATGGGDGDIYLWHRG